MKNRGVAVVLMIAGMALLAIWLRSTRHAAGVDAGADAAFLVAPEPSQSVALQPVAAPAVVIAPVDAGDLDAAQSVACRKLSAENAAVVARTDRADAANGCPAAAPDVGCATTANGVSWGYRLVKAAVKDTNTQDKDSGQWTTFYCETEDLVELVRVDEAGVRAIPDAGEDLDYEWSVKQNALSLTALSDYDGDGEVEILRAHDRLDHESAPEHQAEVLTFKNGNLSAYPPAASFTVEDADDVDRDGRVDLLTRGPYESVTRPDAFGNSYHAADAIFALHSLGDGTFSMTDVTARAFTRGKCPARRKLDMVIDSNGTWDTEQATSTIVCARLWGATEQDVARMWDRSCATVDAGGFWECQTWPKELGAVKPPFTLR